MLGAWIPYERGYDMPEQAIMIDLAQKKAYFFNIVIWPEELYYLTLSLIIAAVALFVCTSLFGRAWCGYACPHTTMVDVFMLVEKLVQGDRNARMKLDNASFNNEKLIEKSLTHFIWLILSFLFGFSWVGYFYGVRQLAYDTIHFSVTANGTVWLLALTFTTYLFGGFLRERVCMHMCPYGRFQSGLIDDNTILVAYHEWRGEPRGKGVMHGDCIDCGKCVIACPMGIDIRNGLQMACIGCGLCVDACDEVMDKTGRPKGLIEYTSSNRAKILQQHWTENKTEIKKIILTPKVIFYSSVLTVAICCFFSSLIMKSPVIFQIDKINSPLFTLTPDGSTRNAYQLHIMNKTITLQDNLCLSVYGMTGEILNVQSASQKYQDKFCFALYPGESLDSQVFIKLPRDYVHNIKNKYSVIKFMLKNDNLSFETLTSFYVRN